MTTTEKLATAEELARVQGRAAGIQFELIRGELIKMTPAGGRHGKTALTVGAMLLACVNKQNLGHVAANDTGVFTERNPDTVLGPDVVFWNRQRLPEMPEGFVEVSPDLVVEVVSPNDGQSYVQRKVLHYLDHGVPLVWVVDPKTRTTTVYRSRQDVCILEADDEITGADILPGFSCRVGEFFD